MMIENNFLARDSPLRELVGNWKDFFNTAPEDDDVKLFQLHERTGRPLGDSSFIEKLESLFKINLKKGRAQEERGIGIMSPRLPIGPALSPDLKFEIF